MTDPHGKSKPAADLVPWNLPIADAQLPETYQKAKAALAECARVDECQDWADRAQAIASYAKQSEDETLYRLAVRIRARAVRKCGELLDEIEAAQGAHWKIKREGDRPFISRQQAAAEAGMSPHQTKQAVRVARVPEEDFERAVESDKPATVTQLADKGRRQRSAPPPPEWVAATALIGAVSHFAEYVASGDIDLAVKGVRPHEIDDLLANIDAAEAKIAEIRKAIDRARTAKRDADESADSRLQ